MIAKMRGNTPEQAKKIRRREKTIIKLLNEGISYEKIGNRFHISKQRVMQIAQRNGIGDRWGKVKKYRKKIYKAVTKDIKAKLSFDEILNKYAIGKNKLSNIFRTYFNTSLSMVFRKKRNNKIIKDFVKGDTAKTIVKNPDKLLDDPTKIMSLNGIYKINVANGIKRYPQIGNRHLGGIFEDRKILDYIVNKRDKNKWTFIKITNELNRLGYKTLTNKKFSVNNTIIKYLSYKKNKNKKLHF